MSAAVKGRYAIPRGLGQTLDSGRPGGWWEGMNDPEVTMPEALHSPFDLDRVALAAASVILAMARAIPTSMRFLTDQLSRAACSVPLNLAEGHGRAGRDRVQHYRIAYGSAREASTAIQLLLASGSVPRSQGLAALELLDRVRAMTWRLIHPKR